MKKYIWLIIAAAIVVARTAETGFNANSFADSLGISTGNFLIGLGCAFVWWLITRTTLSANWKWFDGFNAASYVMALLFILHLTVPKWLENESQKPQSTVAPEEYDWDAVEIEPIASSKAPVNQTDWSQFKSAEDANTPQLPEGFEFEKDPTIKLKPFKGDYEPIAVPTQPEINQRSSLLTQDWETRIRAWEAANQDFLSSEAHRTAVNRWITEYGAVQSISNAELIALIEMKALNEFGYAKARTEPRHPGNGPTKSTVLKEQKCQQQFFAAIDKADQDMPLAEFSEYQEKARQIQIACNSR